MISHPYQCIFIHIPKCGGASIEHIIWPNRSDRTEQNLWRGLVSKYNNKYQTGGLQHLLARQVKLETGADIFEQYFKFAIVRNPWDKAVSQFSYMNKRQDLREFIGMREKDPFKKYLSLIQKTRHVQWEPQHAFLESEDGEPLVNFIGKFESFEKDIRHILNTIKLDGIEQIPHKNKSSRTHYRDYYDTESEEIIREMYKKDIAVFDYSF